MKGHSVARVVATLMAMRIGHSADLADLAGLLAGEREMRRSQ
jgi:hypothetical protein